MEKKVSIKKDFIALILGVIIFISVIIYSILQSEIRLSNHYTIGTPTSISRGFVDFYYYVNHKKYTSSITLEADPEEYPVNINKRYFVKFIKDKPSWGSMCVDKPVPDSIKEAPPEGWIGLPIKE